MAKGNASAPAAARKQKKKNPKPRKPRAKPQRKHKAENQMNGKFFRNPQQAKQMKQTESTMRKMASAAAKDKPYLTNLLHQVMDPSTAYPMRMVTLGDSLQAVGTAVVRNYEAFTRDFTLVPDLTGSMVFLNGKGAPLLEKPEYQVFILLRDPVVAFIEILTRTPTTEGGLVYPDSSYMAVSYDADTMNADGTPSTFGLLMNNREQLTLEFSDFSWTSGPKDWGDSIVCARNNLPGSMVWVDAGIDLPAGAGPRYAELTVRCQGFSALPGDPNTLQLELMHVDGQGSEKTVQSLDFALITGSGIPSNTYEATAKAQFSAYYKLRLNYSENGATPWNFNVVSIKLTQRGSIACRHWCMQSYTTSRSVVDSVRVLGASLLLSNVAPNITKSSTVYGMVLMADRPWYEYTSTLQNSVLDGNITGRYQKGWENGIYTFCKPQNKDSLGLNDATFDYNGRRLSNFQPFRNLGSNIVAIERAQGTAVGGTSNLLNCMATRDIEFTTQSQMFDVRPATQPPAVFEEFITAIRTSENFFENPWHWSDIGSFIKNVANKVVQYAPVVAHYAGAAAALL